MPYKRKDSNLWYAIYTDASGQRTRRSTGTSNKKEAQEIEAKWRMEVRRERVFGEKPALSFEAMMVAYLKQCQSERERYATKALLGHFAGRTMDRLGPQDIHGYKAARTRQGIAKATVNRELNVLCAAINHAITELGHTLPNPVTGRKYDGIEHRVRWLTTAEAQRLISAAEASRTGYLADFIRLALHTGMRKNELLGLEWSRVDLANRLIHLGAEHTKTNTRRSIPINEIALQALRHRLEQRMRAGVTPWVFYGSDGGRIGDIKKAFGAACRRAGIADFHIHDLRHTCASWLVSSGVPLSEVAALLGHASTRTTEIYAHLAPERVRAAVATLDQLAQFGTQSESEML